MNYNFTERVRKVLSMARQEAIRLQHDYVGTEHILLGLIREGEGVAAHVLGNLNVDLDQVHRPDMFTHPSEVAAALDGLVADGLVGAVGVSNYTPAQTRALAAHLDAPLVSTQPEYSAACLDPLRDGTLDLCSEIGMVPLAWSPLAGGRLMAHADESSDVRPELLAVLDRLAEREDVDRAAVCVAFVLAHPTAPVAIVGSQQPERLEALQTALGVQLDRNDVYDLVEASEGQPLP